MATVGAAKTKQAGGGGMRQMVIDGNTALRGTIRPAAAKNSVLPLMAATLLCDAPCVLQNVPRLRDVDTSLTLLAAVGAKAVRCGNEIRTRPAMWLDGRVPAGPAAAMRSSVFYLAPLLTRVGTVKLPAPGGCRLGPRPIDLHLTGLAALGAAVELRPDGILLRRSGPLRGTDFTLRMPSVGATETMLMAAALAQGTTVLRGAACEPEVQDLARFLNACGASIHGVGTPVVTVVGRAALSGCCFAPLPDRIAAGTYLAAGAAAGGCVTVKNCRAEHLTPFLQFLQRVGCEVCVSEDGTQVRVTRSPEQALHGGQEIFTAGWPGFPTDLAPLAAAVLLFADGASMVLDNLFENRFACAMGFAALGAQVRVEGRSILLQGMPGRFAGEKMLCGAKMTVPDLRGGAALAVAALGACGRSVLQDDGHIARGYEHLAEDLAGLGARCREKVYTEPWAG